MTEESTVSEHRPDHTPDPARDPAFDRLRAADPAARLDPDLDALETAVRARLDSGDGLALSGGPDQLAAARRARRPSRWAAVAAVAAGTLVVGSAGYALGERADVDDPAPLSVAMPGPPGGTSDAAAAQGAAPVPGEVRSAAPEGADAAMLPWFGGRTVFRAEGLPDEAGVAEAWGYDPAQVFGPETASLVASSLGLGGEPRLDGVTWTVGSQDGTGAGLQLQPDGVTSVSYYDPTLDPFACAQPVPEPGAATEEDAGAGSSGSAPAPDATDCGGVDGATALQGDAAVAQAREVVAGAGADPDAFEYEVMDAGVPSATYVTAFGTIGGQRTGSVWSMTLVGEAVQSLYGALAPLVPLGTYDVVSALDAVDRLADPRFGVTAGGPIMARDAAATEPAVEPDQPVSGGGSAGPTGSPPPAARPDAPFAWPVTEVALTSAQLGLAQHTQPDGSTVVLPSYTLSSDDGATWSVVAVADSGLDFDALE
ncbi:hypothetical protein [uncultured Cellulomonas sp.]|uniref:hypothetical protein n=1 Tax=uncultured Cellulomonas sp. TaxID=189682 RepID=UPI00260BEFD7|nr:hypothetical protein [uncultured Cellulomonas sp.]